MPQLQVGLVPAVQWGKDPQDDATIKRWLERLLYRATAEGQIDHNTLDNLQGGTTDEYYHLTSAQHTALANVGALGNNRVLYSNGSGVITSEAAFGYAETTDTLTAGTVTATNLNGAINVVDAASDTTTFPVLAGAATGNQALLTDAGLAYNASTNVLSAGALEVTGSTNPTNGISLPSANTIFIRTNGERGLRMGGTDAKTTYGPSSGATTAIPASLGSNTPQLQVQSVSGQATAALSVMSFNNANTAAAVPSLTTGKSRGTALATFTIVQAQDALLEINASGADGTDLALGGYDVWTVDAAPGNNAMPTRKGHFLSPTGSQTPVEVFRLTSAQQGIFWEGTDARPGSLTFGTARQLQAASDQAGNGFSIGKFSADAVSGEIEFAKSRSAALGTNTIVNASDVLGTTTYYGANGTTYTPAAQQRAIVDGTPGATNDMPGAFIWAVTADGAGTLTDRLKLTNAGNFIFSQDNTNDLGAAAATRPRTGYFGTSVITPLVDSGAASAISLDTNTGTKQVEISHVASASRYITLAGSNGGNPTIGVSAGSLAITPITVHANKIYPGTDGAAAQTAAGIYGGTGAPNNANGSDGDFYFRSDGAAGTQIYKRAAGAWGGIV